ncbi:MAG: zinc-ribbon domain-containing protein [Acinetobacter johnsonii]
MIKKKGNKPKGEAFYLDEIGKRDSFRLVMVCRGHGYRSMAVHTDIILKCNHCDHEWKSSAFRVMRGSGCPECAYEKRWGRRKTEKKTPAVNTELVSLIESLVVSGIKSGRFSFPLHFIKRSLDIKAKMPELRDAMNHIAANSGGRLKLDGDTIRFE